MLSIHPFTRSSFWLKVAVTVLLGGLADFLFFKHPAGATVGAFAAAWLVGVLAARRGLLKDRRALVALAVALGLAGVLVDRPSLPAWLLFGLMLTIAVLSARVRQGEPAWRWVQRLAVHGLVTLIGPLLDVARVLRSGRTA
ncbi:MAG: hypothetical protein EON87_10235, partial [Brevundimonas sp.]